MDTRQRATVAVLLATYNGARFIESQIKSLKENVTPFTLHWLDDHSTDNCREAVRSAALSAEIELREWHSSQHLGLPGAFFQLVECVDSDIYLFCDQDDIWQPGKIDATVANLLPDITAPVLCFSEALLFHNDAPGILRPAFDFFGTKLDTALQESKSLLSCPAQGNTMGFTRSLREIFLKHKDIARSYAAGHDIWMYLIAIASGTARMLFEVPTALYRWHGRNVTGAYLSHWANVPRTWRIQKEMRLMFSRTAQGLCLASETLIPGPKLERLLAIARLVATLERRQSPAELVRLAYRGAMPTELGYAIWLAAACLFSHAKRHTRPVIATSAP